MCIRKVYPAIIIASILLLNACGTSSVIAPTATSLPVTSTNVPPTITSAPPTSTTVPPTEAATQSPTTAPTRISPAPELDPMLGRVEGVLIHSKAGPLAKYQISLLDPNKDRSDPTAYVVKKDTEKDGYYFLDAKPGIYTLDVAMFTHNQSDYVCSKTPEVGQVQFGFVEMPLPYEMFVFNYGRPKQNDWLIGGFIENLTLEAGKIIEINMEIDC